VLGLEPKDCGWTDEIGLALFLVFLIEVWRGEVHTSDAVHGVARSRRPRWQLRLPQFRSSSTPESDWNGRTNNRPLQVGAKLNLRRFLDHTTMCFR